MLVDGAGTRKLMDHMGNPESGTEVGLLAPVVGKWFLLFEYDDVGHVKDDEKDSLDTDAILESMKKGNEKANKERRKRGFTPLKVVGWGQKPVYNPKTKNLEWGVIAESEGSRVLNYDIRILGREGVMRVRLVDGPQTFQKSLQLCRQLLPGFSFVKGETYAEYKKGDKLAKYGLTALIAGGAAAVAVKSGLFRWIWKGLVFAFVAIGGLFKKVFGGGRKSRR